MSKNLAIFRLAGGTRTFEYPMSDGKVVKINCHYPEEEEKVAAQTEAGVEFSDELLDFAQSAEDGKVKLRGKETQEFILRQAHAAEVLACLCIESVEGFDIQIIHVPFKYGLSQISPDNREQIHRSVLRQIGKDLLTDSQASEEENFPLGQSPSGTSSKSSESPETTANPVETIQP